MCLLTVRLRSAVTCLFLTVAAMLAFCGQTRAQLVVGADNTLTSKYVWRGLTRSNDWVWQPNAYAAASIWKGFLTVEYWNNWQLGRTDATELSGAGLGESGRTESNLSVMYRFYSNPVVLGLGWVDYRFFGNTAASGRGSEHNSGEVFGSLELRPVHFFAPKVSVWYDYREVKGAYLETTASFRFPVSSVGVEASIYLDGVAGFAVRMDPAPGELSHFDDNGLTHIAVSPTFVAELHTMLARLLHVRSFPSVAFLFEPLRFQYNIDTRTRQTSAALSNINDRVTWHWLTVTISIAGGIGPR